MTTQPRRSAVACFAIACTLPACQFTQTTTTTARIASPEVTRVRLAQSHSVPISGTWRQEGRAVVGRVAFTTECRLETTQGFERREVTETRTDTPAMKAWTFAGGVVGLVGVGWVMASAGKDEPWYPTLALTGAAVGITTAVGGGMLIARKPQVEARTLGTDQVTKASSSMHACGIPGSLHGMELAVSWAGLKPMTGLVARDGTARIEIAPGVALPDSAVRVVVASVPASAAGIVARGTAVGELRLASETAAPARVRCRDCGRSTRSLR